MDTSDIVPKRLEDFEHFLHSPVIFFSFGDEAILDNKHHHSIDSVLFKD